MKTRTLSACLAAGSAIAMLVACASDEQADLTPPPNNQAVPPPDSGAPTDGGAPDDDDAGCSDCEHFPETCDETTLCSFGPFAADTQNGPLDNRTRIFSIRGRSVDDVWAVGALGAVAHFDGKAWTRMDPGSTSTIKEIWLKDDGKEIALADADELFTRGIDVPDAGPSADGWTKQVPATVASEYTRRTRELSKGWAPAGSDSFWVATRGVSTSLTTFIYRLRMTFDGLFHVEIGVPITECSAARCPSMRAIHGLSPASFWAVGSTGTAMQVTVQEDSTVTTKFFETRTWNSLNGVVMLSRSEAWAVGATGTIRHYVGAPHEWDVVEPLTTADLNAVAATSPTDVWAVGARGVVLHYDGTSWSRVKIAGLGRRRPDLFSVWSPQPGHVWIAGQGVVLSLGGKP